MTSSEDPTAAGQASPPEPPEPPEPAVAPGRRPVRRRAGLSDQARQALVDAVVRRQSDSVFADMVRRIAEDDREILDRLAR